MERGKRGAAVVQSKVIQSLSGMRRVSNWSGSSLGCGVSLVQDEEEVHTGRQSSTKFQRPRRAKKILPQKVDMDVEA